ncbi:hypothetical protein Hanom_Chr03g00187601 [Helianthus anomalus]
MASSQFLGKLNVDIYKTKTTQYNLTSLGFFSIRKCTTQYYYIQTFSMSTQFKKTHLLVCLESSTKQISYKMGMPLWFCKSI